MNRLGHLTGLIFTVILLTASKTFLEQYPLSSAGFLLIASFFYIISTAVSKKSFFLYPVMFFGGLAYYLFLYSREVSYIWYGFYSLFLVIFLALAEYLSCKNDKFNFAKAFNNGINITVTIFTIWILSFANLYWKQIPLIYILTFFGYAVFYFFRNFPKQEKKSYIYIYLYYVIAGVLALNELFNSLPIIQSLILSILVFGFAYIGIVIYKRKGHTYAIAVFSAVLFSSLFSFIYTYSSWNGLTITFFTNTIAAWFLYKTIKEDIVGNRISIGVEKFILRLFKTGFILLPCLFWSLLIYKGFPLNFINIFVTVSFVILFALFTKPPYKSLFKTRNHYVYISGAFITVIYYAVLFNLNFNKSYSLLFTPILICVILLTAIYLKNKNTIISNSVIDLANLPVAINILTLSFITNFKPEAGVLLTLIILTVLAIFLRILKASSIGYAVVLTLWFGLYSIANYFNLSVYISSIIYLISAILSALIIYTIFKTNKNNSKVFQFGLVLFSITALYLSNINIDLHLSVLVLLSLTYLNIGAMLKHNKKKNIFTKIAHIMLLYTLAIILLNKLFDQAVYTTLILSLGYFIPLLLYKKDEYLYPAGILFSIGYLLLLIKICPVDWIMIAYLPLIVLFLCYCKSIPVLICAYFSSAIILIWVLGAGITYPVLLVFSSLSYGVAYVISGK